MSGFDPNYGKLIEAVQHLLSCFFDVWEQMCKPFIPDFYMSTAGGNYYPTWSYVLPVIAIGICFSMIVLAKKITFMLIERRD